MPDSKEPAVSSRPADAQPHDFRHRIFTAVAIAVGVILFLIVLYITADVLLLLFIGVLIAVALRTASHWLHTHTPLPEIAALTIVVVAVLALIILLGALIGPSLATQVDQLVEQIPEALGQLETQLGQTELGRQLVDQIPQDSEWASMLIGGQTSSLFARITGIFSSSVSFLGNLVLLLFTALFLAIEPQTYINGAAQLVPPARRDRAREVLLAVGDTLAKWLLTRAISMVAIGILTTLGLILLDVPLALSLGLIAGVMAFIPMIGPIIALLPALLISIMASPQTAIWVFVLYMVVQGLDNYLLTPIVVKRTIRMPPALIIFAQLIFGLLFGQLGLMLAAPLTAALMTLTQMVYVHDFLERGAETGD